MKNTVLERVAREYELEVIPTALSYCMCMLNNNHCFHIGSSTEKEPCYGQVTIEFQVELGLYIHTCEGHQWIMKNNALYKCYSPEES